MAVALVGALEVAAQLDLLHLSRYYAAVRTGRGGVVVVRGGGLLGVGVRGSSVSEGSGSVALRGRRRVRTPPSGCWRGVALAGCFDAVSERC